MAFTPDAIAVDDESALDKFYEPNKTKIWAAVGVLFLGMVAFVAIRESGKATRSKMWARYYASADLFELNPLGDVDASAAKKQIDSLNALVLDYPDEKVTPYAIERIAKAQFALGDFDAAAKSFEDLQSRFKDFPANSLPAEPDASGRARSVTQKLIESVRAEKSWAESRKYEHHYPDEDRLALVETNAGSFWLGFYDAENEAPQHVESFVKHAKAGDYNGTQIYEIITTTDGSPEKVSLGSRASGLKEKGGVLDPSLHDADEPTDTVEPEESRATIRHYYRVVSAAKMPSGESAMRFSIVTRKSGLEKLNGETTPFAAVMDREGSLATLDKIAHGSTYVNHPKTQASPFAYKMRDHPFPQIYIRRVTIWSKEKLEEGHTWKDKDLDQKASDAKPDWEDARGEGPMPEEFNAAPPVKKDDEKKDEVKKDGEK